MKLYPVYFFIVVLFLQSCVQEKLNILEANKCNSCNDFLKDLTKLKSNSYHTKKLKNLGNLIPVDGINWEELAKKKIYNKRKIFAVEEKDYRRFNDNIHCLIGLKLKSIKKYLPTKYNTYQSQTDSTLNINFTFETVNSQDPSNIFWTGTNSFNLAFRKSNWNNIFVGHNLQKYRYRKCILEGQN